MQGGNGGNVTARYLSQCSKRHPSVSISNRFCVGQTYPYTNASVVGIEVMKVQTFQGA